MLLSLATVNTYVLYDGSRVFDSLEYVKACGPLVFDYRRFLLLTENYNGRRLFSRNINMTGRKHIKIL